MKDNIKQLISSPQFDDEEKNRIAGILNVILFTLLVTGAFMAFFLSLFGFVVVPLTLVAGLAVVLICLWLLKRGWVRVAGFLVLFMLLLMVAFILYAGFGVHDPAIMLLPIIIIVAGLILGTWSFVFFVGLTALLVGVVIYLEVTGYIEAAIFTRDPKWMEFLIYSIFLVITAVTVRLLTQNLKNNLARARRAEAQWKTWVNNAPDSIFHLQQDGTIDFLNNAEDQSEVIGRTVFDYADPEFHAEIRTTINQVIKTGKSASCEVIGYRQPEVPTWFVNRFGPVKENDGITDLIMISTDITERRNMEVERNILVAELEAKNEALQQEVLSHRETENALRSREETARQFQHQLIALQEVSIELTQAESLDDLCYRTIKLGLSRLDYDRLGIWFIDETDPNYMIGSFGTDAQGQICDERHLRLPKGPEGFFEMDSSTELQMKSWRRSVLYDGEHNPIGEGWNVLAPLWQGNKVIGFLSADNLIRKRPFSQDVLDLLGLYASTLSHLIFRVKGEEKTQKRRDMLEKVVVLGKDVTQVVDLRECLLRIYNSVKEGLGFDRVGLFLYEADEDVLIGSFGTDREGNLQEEWDMILPANAVSPSGKSLHMADSLLYVEDFQQAYRLADDEVAEGMVGVKDHARIVSWVGKQPVAVINVDNFVTGRRIHEAQLEALQIFAGYAGLAVENARLLAQVREAEKQYRSIFENAIEGIFQVTQEGRFLSANPALAHMLGYDSPEELIENIADIGHDIYTEPQQRLKLRQQLAEQQRIQNFEFEVKQRDGRRAWLSQNVHVVYDENHKPLYFEGTAQDITDRKEVEAERVALIEELEIRNAELERFTYTVSHDLKSPLITIRGFLGFVEQDAVAGNIDQLRRDIQRITDATTRMQQLLEELLELSRVGRLTNPPEKVNFSELVEEVTELVSGRLMERGIPVLTVTALPDVFVDRPRIVEVLQNLIDNAAKFMGDQPDPKIEIGQEQIDGESVFFVRDNGIGVATAYQKRVFDLFERLDQSIEGSGVGLALVKRIIEVHNGRLWLESEGIGKGTTFYFTLPISQED